MSSSEIETAKEKEVSFFRELVRRRVPQIIGIYLGVSWGIIQFTEWLVDRYMFSPHLIDLTIVILLSLIPSSIIIAYHHGRPGRDKWRKTEKIGIPFNLALTVLLVLFIFSGKDLGSVSRTVTLEDETGKKIERVVPKSRFRKKLALFFFKNETGDASLDWLQYGISQMLEFDLGQDLFIEVLTPHSQGIERSDFYIYNKIKKAGYKDGTGLPLMLQKKIAGEIRMDYFLSGEISRQGEDFILESSLYHTKNAKLADKNTVRGKDIFKLIDDLSVRLKEDLEIPKSHIEEANDLPVARLYTLGFNLMAFETNWSNAQHHFEKSIREDPTFALAHNYLAAVYLWTNQTKKWVKAYQTLMQYSYKLPERWQLYVKMGYYLIKQDPDKQLAVLRMIIKLYPEDLNAHSLLALFLTARNQWDEVIATYKRMLEIDPQRYEIFKKIGASYETKGEFDRASVYYEKYAEHFPKDPESFKIIGGLNRKKGNLEQAKDYYEKALLLEPDNISVLTVLAEIEENSGNFDKAFQQLEEALHLSQTPKERATVYRFLASFCEHKGQMKRALEYSQLYIKAIEEYSPPLMVVISKVFIFKSYIRAGKEKEAFQRLAALESELTSPLDKFLSIGYLMAYLELEKPGEAEKRLPGLQDLIATFGIEQFQAILHAARGKIHEMRRKYEDAIKSYEAQLKIAPTSTSSLKYIGRCYRHLKQYKKAEEYIRRTLKTSPFDPKSNYELALVYLDMGDKDKAVKHLKIAVKVWKDADPDYKPAQRAKETLATFVDIF